MGRSALRERMDSPPTGRGYGGGDGGRGETPGFPVPTAKLGLWLLMGSVTMLFSAILSVYVVRMGFGDWRPLREPLLLALNTLLLALASGAMHWAWLRGRRGDLAGVRVGVLLGGALAMAFLVGQVGAWRLLTQAGAFLASGPSADFFYFITGVHGLHLLGGLVVWAWVAVRGLRNRFAGTGLSLELLTYYWHFLFLVWLVFYALMLVT